MNLMLSIILVSFPYSIKILLVYDVYFFIIPFTRFSARFLLKLVAKQIKHIYIYMMFVCFHHYHVLIWTLIR
jgi:hypothetical protein